MDYKSDEQDLIHMTSTYTFNVTKLRTILIHITNYVIKLYA
jgi:hypothetical protein